MEATEDIPAGCQVFDTYGRKCNSRFFLNYGFISANNEANEVPLLASLDEDDPLFNEKLSMLSENKK